AVTQTTPEDPPRRLRISRDALSRGRIERREDGERTLVSCGAPIPDVEVRIETPAPGDAAATPAVAGAELIGEIWLRGPFIMDDYLPSEGLPPRWAFSADGWYRTGDLGAL